MISNGYALCWQWKLSSNLVIHGWKKIEIINVIGAFEMSCMTCHLARPAGQRNLWSTWHIENDEEREII